MGELGRMLEESLTAPLRPWTVFQAQAARPAPAFGVMALNLAFFAAAFLGINLAHATLAFPGAVAFGPVTAALGAGLFLGLGLGALVGAALVHALSRLVAGSGSFARSFQIVSTASACLLIQALFNWFPALWPVPALAAALVTIAGTQCLHRASKPGAWAVFGALAALALAGQWTARRQLQKYAEDLLILRSLNNAAAPPIENENAPVLSPPELPAPPQDSLQSLVLGERGLDHVTSPLGTAPAPRATDRPEPEAAALSETGMMKALNEASVAAYAMLSDPQLLKNLPPAQTKQFKDIRDIMDELRPAPGKKPLTDKERSAIMQRMQKIVAEMSADSMAEGMKRKQEYERKLKK